VQLVVRDPLGVVDAPVQSHVETEGEEAHGVRFVVCSGDVQVQLLGDRAGRSGPGSGL
jgi:hypothetical protein